MSLIHEAIESEPDYSVIKTSHDANDYALDSKIKKYSIEFKLELVYDPELDYVNKTKYADLELYGDDKIPYTDAIDEKWNRFNRQLKKQRRMADMYTLDLIGITNQQYYDYLKQKYMSANDDITPDIYSIREMVNQEIDYSKIHYTFKEITDAIEWSKDTGKIIIVPCRSFNELETMWYNYNSMILKHRRESDWISIYLFGLTNQQHYNYLREKLNDTDSDIYPILDDIKESAPIHSTQSSRFFEQYLSKYYDAPLDEMINTIRKYSESTKFSSELKIVDKAVENMFTKRENAFEVTSTAVPYTDLPFFTPDEMIDFGVYNDIDANYFGAMADTQTMADGTPTSTWFENYKNAFIGMQNENSKQMTMEWLNSMRRLYLGFDEIKESGNKDMINARMQSILELGWNPYVEFTANNRVSARYRIESIMESNANKYTFVDARISESDDAVSESITIENVPPIFKPVYIVFVGGNTAFSDIIKRVTNSKFSHAGISIDSKLESIYSYGMSNLVRTNGGTSFTGGLTKESIKDYPPGTPVSVFGFFVKEEHYNLIQKNLNWFVEQADKTRYSYVNLIAYIFKIPVVRDVRFTCSEFVDRILKLSDIDLSGISSAFVSPADLNARVKDNSKIYHFFDGISDKFKFINLKNKINRLINKASPIKESDLKCLNITSSYKIMDEISSLYSGVEPIINEARVTPIDFDDAGNLLIRGDIFKIDFAAEYSKSHKILMAADQAKSYETMKHELAKLWMMNTIIEKKLHEKINEDKRLQMNTDRAHILNDFKKYINVVLKEEPGFNFSQYYEDSQFNNATTKVSKNMLKYTALTLKRILTSDIKNILPYLFIH